MKNTNYTSYRQIDKQLEILNIERKLAKEKVFLSIENAKESLLPFQEKESIVGTIFSKIPFASVGKMVLPFVIDYFIKRKKG
jgi:hypothetical protein